MGIYDDEREAFMDRFVKDNKSYSAVIKLANKGPHEDPTYSDPGASGFDLRAWITDKEAETFMSGRTITLAPLERRLIHTGIYVELPVGTELQVRPKSGQALKKGLSVLNSPGTVDNNYRGEVCVIAINISNDTIHIQDGEKIAQAVICPVYYGSSVIIEKIDDVDKNTERGDGGFGHNGVL